MTRIDTLFFFLLLSLLLVACAAKNDVDSRVRVIDSYSLSSITIVDVSSIVNSSGLMEIQVTGLNDSSYKRPEYKVQWLDRNGLEVDTILSRWKTFSAYQKAEFRFNAIAPNKSVSDFRVLVRKGS